MVTECSGLVRNGNNNQERQEGRLGVDLPDHGCVFTSVILCNIYMHDKYKSNVIPGLIQKVYEEKKNKTALVTGIAVKQFIYSLDMARFTILAMRIPRKEVSIREVSVMILEAIYFLGDVKFLTDRTDGQLKKTASNGKLRSYLPGFQFTATKLAIKQTVEWYIENHNTARN